MMRVSSRVGGRTMRLARHKSTTEAAAAATGGKETDVSAERRAEMDKAAKKVVGGKTLWQRTMSWTVDTLRPVSQAVAPVLMPLLDMPSKRRCASSCPPSLHLHATPVSADEGLMSCDPMQCRERGKH
jgi:hypothetical protein